MCDYSNWIVGYKVSRNNGTCIHLLFISIKENVDCSGRLSVSISQVQNGTPWVELNASIGKRNDALITLLRRNNDRAAEAVIVR